METLPTKPKVLLQVALYLRGADLDENLVSACLGVEPTNFCRKGEPKVRGRPFPVFRTSTWRLIVECQSADVSKEIVSLLSAIKPQCVPRTISTVDEAFVDVFMVNTVDDDRLGDSIECTLSEESIALLHRFELPLYLSLGNSPGT